MNKITISHLGDLPPRFQLVGVGDGKTLDAVKVPNPFEYPVEGRPHSNLMKELAWYLEVFPGHPLPPFTDQADRILKSLHNWGTEAFDALFATRSAGRLFDAATQEYYADLLLEVRSDDPGVLSWPWEALEDSEVGVLSHTCQIRRRLNYVRDPHPLSDNLSKDGINILLVTARPYDTDVKFRSISRPIVELLAKNSFPGTVTLLRPPTIDQLRRHLKQHPNRYHILHFDGHGSYGSPRDIDPRGVTLRGAEGQLIFEDENGNPDGKPASVLSKLLREFPVPIVVLNACQSAMVDEQAEDAFASVAAGLQKSGVRSVVAMAYSLHVSAAQGFLPAFYQKLFTTGNVAESVRSGRQQLCSPDRVCLREGVSLQDWLVPVLYEQQPMDLTLPSSDSVHDVVTTTLQQDAQDNQNPYGFVGRDAALLQLERAMLRKPAGILIQGFGGIGKTTLVREFVNWLNVTGGIGDRYFWQSFRGIRRAESVVNDMVSQLFGKSCLADSLDTKLAALTDRLRKDPFLFVWDDFEVVRDIASGDSPPTLSSDDHQILLKLLKNLRGGKSKIIIIDSSTKKWPDSTLCLGLSIDELRGDERWEYCESVCKTLNLDIDRTDESWPPLMDAMDGHPLAMRVLLPHLVDSSPTKLLEAIESNVLQFEENDVESQSLFRALRTVFDFIPESLRQFLPLLAMYDRYADSRILDSNAKLTGLKTTDATATELLDILCRRGCANHCVDAIYALHPLLRPFLQCRAGGIETNYVKTFVSVMEAGAQRVARIAGASPASLRSFFLINRRNLLRASVAARRLRMDLERCSLSQAFALDAMDSRDFSSALEFYNEIESCAPPNTDFAVTARIQKSLIASLQGNLSAADRQFAELSGDEENTKKIQGCLEHEKGVIALMQKRYSEAEQCFESSAAIFRTLDEKLLAAKSTHQLGVVARHSLNFDTAEALLRSTIHVFQDFDDRESLARVYLELGNVALIGGDRSSARRWCNRASTICAVTPAVDVEAAISHLRGLVAEKLDPTSAEQSYVTAISRLGADLDTRESSQMKFNLGLLAYQRGDSRSARTHFLQALEGFKNAEAGSLAASAHYELAILAADSGDLDAAEAYCIQSLNESEGGTDVRLTAITYHLLGTIAGERGLFKTAGDWLIKAISILNKTSLGDASKSVAEFARIYNNANCITKLRLNRAWDCAFASDPSNERHQ